MLFSKCYVAEIHIGPKWGINCPANEKQTTKRTIAAHSSATFYVLPCDLTTVNTKQLPCQFIGDLMSKYSPVYLLPVEAGWSRLKSFEVVWSRLKSFEVVWSVLKSPDLRWTPTFIVYFSLGSSGTSSTSGMSDLHSWQTRQPPCR